MAPAQKRSTAKTVALLGLTGVLMFGFAFAMVPLYQLICSVAGINSIATNNGRIAVTENTVDKKRTVTVEFDSTIHNGVEIEFYPKVRKLQIHPGELVEINYQASNLTNKTLVTQAVPGVTPWQASAHLHKVECFCFNLQTLAARETVEMGLRFMIDKKLPKEINTLTLSYAIMKVKDAQVAATVQ